MTEQTKRPEAEIIVVPRARLAFARIHTAEKPRDNQGRVREDAKAKWSCTLLIDPSSKEGQETIAKVKAAATKVATAKWGEPSGWPKANPATGMGGLIKCFGNGNDLPKVYDGFKDMFYVKCSDTSRPLLGNRRGEPVVEGDEQCPYSGCYVRARISPWVYFPTQKNPQSANGINMNFRSLQFVEDGTGYGGGSPRTAEDEFVAIGDAPAAATVTADDPW